MDTTLRDGSYLINFQFTASDTALISRELETVGLTMIEIGHGIGLGAAEAGKGEAAETDEGYMRAVVGTLKIAKWGMFCIPGIAKLEHVDLAANYGMGFIRRSETSMSRQRAIELVLETMEAIKEPREQTSMVLLDSWKLHWPHRKGIA